MKLPYCVTKAICVSFALRLINLAWREKPPVSASVRKCLWRTVRFLVFMRLSLIWKAFNHYDGNPGVQWREYVNGPNADASKNCP